MGTFGNSWELTKLSFSVIKKDKEILILPLISGVFLVIIWILLFASILGVFLLLPSWAAILFNPPVLYAWPFLLFFLYVISYFIVIYFNAAVIACATIRLNGGDPTIRDGLTIASRHMGKIFAWALVSATIGIILQLLSNRAGLAGRIALWLIGVAWSVATYFIVPVLIYEDAGAWESLKKSAGTFKRTFGETFISNITLGLIFFGLALIGLIPVGIGIWYYIKFNTLLVPIICVIAAVIYWIIIACLNSAAEGILIAALYRYAKTGKISPDFAPIQSGFPVYTNTPNNFSK